jgi:hypothetical protein
LQAIDPSPVTALDPDRRASVARHLRFGWWSLVIFALLGLGLESLHGFKVGWYLDGGNETRRLLLTLAHAHGVLLALVNLAFAGTLRLAGSAGGRWLRLASPCLLLAAVLLPAGFLLGGVVVYGGDPGIGILLLPFGAALLVAGLAATAWGITRSDVELG